jgi:hypothetical protein
VAYLVWAIPFGQLSTFASGRVRIVTIQDGWLRNADGTVHIELAPARGRCVKARGIGYDFYFVELKPRRGRTLWFIASDQADWGELVDRLEQACGKFIRRDLPEYR